MIKFNLIIEVEKLKIYNLKRNLAKALTLVNLYNYFKLLIYNSIYAHDIIFSIGR